MRNTTAAAVAAALTLAAGCGGGVPEPAAPVTAPAPAATTTGPPPTTANPCAEYYPDVNYHDWCATQPGSHPRYKEEAAERRRVWVEDREKAIEDRADEVCGSLWNPNLGDGARVAAQQECRELGGELPYWEDPEPEEEAEEEGSQPAGPEAPAEPTAPPEPGVVVEPPPPAPSLIEEDVLPPPADPDPPTVGDVIRLEATALLRDRMELDPLALYPDQLIWDRPFDSLSEGTRWGYRVCGAPELEDLGIETWAVDTVVTTPTKLDDPGRRMPEWGGQVIRTKSRVAPGNDEPYEYDPPFQVALLAYYDEPNDRWWLPAPAPCVR